MENWYSGPCPYWFQSTPTVMGVMDYWATGDPGMPPLAFVSTTGILPSRIKAVDTILRTDALMFNGKLMDGEILKIDTVSNA